MYFSDINIYPAKQAELSTPTTNGDEKAKIGKVFPHVISDNIGSAGFH